MISYFASLIKKSESDFSTLFIRNGKVSFLIGIAIAILGAFSLSVIPKESQPNIEFGEVVITTPYSGVNASDIDSLITQKIESKVQSITSLDTYSSLSENSISRITLTFDPGTDMTEALSDIRSKVDQATSELPQDLDSDPLITEIDTSQIPFLEIILSGDASPQELGEMGEELKTALEGIKEVSGVNLSSVETEFHVNVKKEKIDALGLSLQDIQNAIRNAHKDTPIGDLEIEGKEYSIRFQGKLKTTEDIAQVPIKTFSLDSSYPQIVTIEDIATVEKNEKARSPILRFSNGTSVHNAISLQVSRSSGADIFRADTEAKKITESFVEKHPTPDIFINYANEGAKVMEEDFQELFQNAVISIGVVLLLIFFFVGFREGWVASLVIPLSFLMTIFALFATGGTMNFMTNFSMILAIGILVDTAIIIVEGASHFLKKGYSPRESALLSFYEFRGPLFSGMATTLVVFFPLFFLPGVLGKFLAYIPITVTFVLTSALFISLFLIPAYSAFFLKKNQKESRFRTKLNQFFDSIMDFYASILMRIIPSQIKKWGLMIGMIGIFIGSFFLPIPFDQFPSEDSDSLNITVEKSIGTPSAETLQTAIQVEKKLLALPETKLIRTEINNHTASIYMELFPMAERKKNNLRTSKQIQFFLDEDFTLFSDADVRVKPQSAGPPVEFPINFRVILSDAEHINTGKEITQTLTQMLKETEGTQGVNNNVEESPGEYRYTINREKAMKLGVSPDMIANTVRTALFGTTVATITKNNQDIDIRVQFPSDKIQTITDLQNIKITPSLPLSELVSVEKREALSKIERYEGDIMFRVSSLVGEGGNATEITEKFSEKIGLLSNTPSSFVNTLPEGIRIQNASESAENADLYASLNIAGVLAILMIFTILVIQFNSFSQPLLILMTILFAQVGVAFGLFITDTPKSLAYILGVISLAGIVVNDAIIMVDKMNKNIRSETFTDRFQAIAEAGKSRFIPVVLTTLTTSAGIIPLIFVDAFWAGLSYTVVFGLSLASFLTLIMIPVGYTLFWKKI